MRKSSKQMPLAGFLCAGFVPQPYLFIHRHGADVHILNPTRWMYRVRPSVAHRPLRPCKISAEVICFFSNRVPRRRALAAYQFLQRSSRAFSP